jgi:lipopolysaccharide/colanic/teichoic acid biosynthesis glycosyltransferase
VREDGRVARTSINQKNSKFVETTLNQESVAQVSAVKQSGQEKAETIPAIPFWKRALDISLIVITAPVTVLVGAVLALIIKCGSHGPVIFKQRRVGYKGSTFTCYKFRTMHLGAETGSHRGHVENLIKSGTTMTKLDAKNDSRVIPFGKIIRATGLDELPQLINVLKGEMSLVGPRPCIPYEYEVYETWQKRRFNAVPGLTGLWQVSGKNRTTFNQMINFDIEYSERANLLLDTKIILKTVPALMMQCYDQRVRSKQARATETSVNAQVGKPVGSFNA